MHLLTHGRTAALVLALVVIGVTGCGGQPSTDAPLAPRAETRTVPPTITAPRSRDLPPSSSRSTPAGPSATAACSSHPNQAAAQRAADTRDPDHDGLYCESLRCPCTPTTPGAPPATEAVRRHAPCQRPKRVQPVGFSATRYPRIRAHALDAIKRGWPPILVLNRAGADARRDQLLEGVPTRTGYDRDEYPPAVGRGRGKDLVHGATPRGWRADVAYVPSGENRSHGSVLGIKLRRFCDGTRFRYVFY